MLSVSLTQAEREEMCYITIALTTMMAVVVGVPASFAQSSAASGAGDVKAIVQPAEPPTQSGVFGFSGGKVPYSDPEGVVGECIWIFDAQDKAQVAKGDCAERTPGQFRVVLKPGRYVVHGPGGNTPIEVTEGKWIKVESIVALPLAP
jgi:hypothetical protein